MKRQKDVKCKCGSTMTRNRKKLYICPNPDCKIIEMRMERVGYHKFLKVFIREPRLALPVSV